MWPNCLTVTQFGPLLIEGCSDSCHVALPRGSSVWIVRCRVVFVGWDKLNPFPFCLSFCSLHFTFLSLFRWLSASLELSSFSLSSEMTPIFFSGWDLSVNLSTSVLIWRFPSIFEWLCSSQFFRLKIFGRFLRFLRSLCSWGLWQCLWDVWWSCVQVVGVL